MTQLMRSLAALVFLWLPSAALSDSYLLMAEEAGCYWCGRWNADIAEIYPKTAEGQAAPLRRYDLMSEQPEADLAQPVRFTPTFILVKDGVEVGRIEGYPGEDFFWGLLGQMLDRANIETEQAS